MRLVPGRFNSKNIFERTALRVVAEAFLVVTV